MSPNPPAPSRALSDYAHVGAFVVNAEQADQAQAERVAIAERIKAAIVKKFGLNPTDQTVNLEYIVRYCYRAGIEDGRAIERKGAATTPPSVAAAHVLHSNQRVNEAFYEIDSCLRKAGFSPESYRNLNEDLICAELTVRAVRSLTSRLAVLEDEKAEALSCESYLNTLRRFLNAAVSGDIHREMAEELTGDDYRAIRSLAENTQVVHGDKSAPTSSHAPLSDVQICALLNLGETLSKVNEDEWSADSIASMRNLLKEYAALNAQPEVAK